MNKALLNTDIFPELAKGVDQAVARNCAAYRAAFGRYTISAITVMEIARAFGRNGRPGNSRPFMPTRRGMDVLEFQGSQAR